jgi:hypothetical protein
MWPTVSPPTLTKTISYFIFTYALYIYTQGIANLRNSSALSYDEFTPQLAKKQKVLTASDSLSLANVTVSGESLSTLESQVASNISEIATLSANTMLRVRLQPLRTRRL